jgi:hypothetical protein
MGSEQSLSIVVFNLLEDSSAGPSQCGRGCIFLDLFDISAAV